MWPCSVCRLSVHNLSVCSLSVCSLSVMTCVTCYYWCIISLRDLHVGMLHPCEPAQCADSQCTASQCTASQCTASQCTASQWWLVSRAIIGVLFPSGTYAWGCYIHITLLSKDPLSDNSRQLNWEFAMKGGLVSKTLIFVIVFNLVFYTAVATLGKWF